MHPRSFEQSQNVEVARYEESGSSQHHLHLAMCYATLRWDGVSVSFIAAVAASFVILDGFASEGSDCTPQNQPAALRRRRNEN